MILSPDWDPLAPFSSEREEALFGLWQAEKVTRGKLQITSWNILIGASKRRRRKVQCARDKGNATKK